jgi:hypothetical protein
MGTEVENKEIKIKNGHEMLRELCSFEADINCFTNNLNPISNRVQYIMAQLDANNIVYKIDKYQPIKDTPDFIEGLPVEVNIIVEIEGLNQDLTTVFTAHHDVANMHSENAQDNSASVCNLLDLCIRLSNNKPANNVVVCFNDSEEKVLPNTCGIKRFSNQIIEGKYGKVKCLFVLELTAVGNCYWMSYFKENLASKTIREINLTTIRVRTPYSDAFVTEKMGIDSVCIGSLNEGNMRAVETSGYCHTWSLCHSLEDKFENANEGDMSAFVNFLETLIQN